MTNLLLLRESAKFIKTSLGYSGTEIVRRDAFGDIIADYIIETIDPSPDEPITEDWLLNEWGFYKNGKYFEHDTIPGVFTFKLDECQWWMDGLIGGFTTRQQFCDLTRSLGIPRQKAKLEQSSESYCGKCGKKLKQTKKGVQYCECWMPTLGKDPTP